MGRKKLPYQPEREQPYGTHGPAHDGGRIAPATTSHQGGGPQMDNGSKVDNGAARGSAREVSDFSSFCEGDVEPTLNKRIHTLIECDTDYIVYLNDDLGVEWSSTTGYGQFPVGYSDVANQIGHLETLGKGRLSRTQNEAFERVLGEAMARILGEKTLQKANESLIYAEAYLDARSIENARAWYLETALVVTIPAAVGILVLWLARSSVQANFGDQAFALLLGSAFGAVGALLSILIRVRKLDVDAAAGPYIHRLESGARIGVGAIGALVVGLGVKANLLFAFANGKDSLAAFLAVCLVAGASERIVPGFIKQIEDTASGSRGDQKSSA